MNKKVYALAELTRTGCPNLIRYFGSWWEEGKLFIQFELCPLGTITSYYTVEPSDEDEDDDDDDDDDDEGGNERDQDRDDDDDDDAVECLELTRRLSIQDVVLSSRQESGDMDDEEGEEEEEERREEGERERDRRGQCGRKAQRKDKHSRVMAPREVAALIAQMAAALSHMHTVAGIAHLDVKPDNILLAGFRSVGLALQPGGGGGANPPSSSSSSAVGESSSSTSQTIGDRRIQTVLIPEFRLADLGKAVKADLSEPVSDGDSVYMSRELLQEPPPSLTPADIFALGASAFEMMSAKALPSRGRKWHALREGKVDFPPLPQR